MIVSDAQWVRERRGAEISIDNALRFGIGGFDDEDDFDTAVNCTECLPLL